MRDTGENLIGPPLGNPTSTHMSQSDLHFQLLLPTSAEQLIARPVGKLTPVPGDETEALPFIALDCFDQSLRRSGHLLLEAGRDFELLRDGKPLITLPATGKPRFITEFSESALKQALSGLSPLRKLLPAGSGTRAVTSLIFVDDEGKTHCRARLLRFETDEGRSLHLVELQGIRGYSKSLKLLQMHIQRLGGTPVRCSALYSQLFPTRVSYDAKPDILISSSETAFDAATKIIASCLPVLRANEAGIIADHDTEFLHDYRIQLRKIRSVLSLFKGVYDAAQTAELKARFSALAAPTGRLRDLDVYLLEKDTYSHLLPESLQDGLDRLFEIFSEQRAAEHAKLSKHLRSTAYKREIARLAKLFKRPKELKPGVHAGLAAHEYACERIWQHYRKVRKAAMAIGADTPDADIHELRIRCKKLRYLIEFFSPVFPAPALSKVLKPLKRLQEHLGLFNDYSVQQEALHAFLAPDKGRNDAGIAVAQSVGALIAVLHGRQLEERDSVLMSLGRFNRPGTQQAFSALFQNQEDDT